MPGEIVRGVVMRMIALLVLLGMRLGAQSVPATLAGSGYRTPPNAIEAAPGQVMIVSLHGIQARLTAPVEGVHSPGTGLATTVAGISAQLVQASGRTPVSIYGVSQTPCAPMAAPCSPVTNVTLVVPFQLTATAVNSYAGLEFKEGTNVITTIPVRAVPDRAHIVNSCDESLVYYSVFGGENLTGCNPAVVRPQGGLITPYRAVRAGEPLVAFAHGLGDANPSPAGGGAFVPGLTKQPFVLRYAVAGGAVYWAQAPDGVSLTTAWGVYQVHFTVPPLPDNAPLPACGERGLYGNVTVTISGIHSSDKFELCVTP